LLIIPFHTITWAAAAAAAVEIWWFWHCLPKGIWVLSFSAV